MGVSTQPIRDVTIVGGGDVGLLTALALEAKTTGLEIRVIDDFSTPVPNIGKSTFDTLVSVLHDDLSIDEARFVSMVAPVWKSSVYFKSWRDCEPFHIEFDSGNYPLASDTAEQFEEMHYRYAQDRFETVNTEMVSQRKTPFKPSESEDRGLDKYWHFAYHLDVDRFNGFLRTLCEERGITLVDDLIDSVSVSAGQIQQVSSETATYEADLYLDATGFRRTLIGELPSSFTQFDLPLDSAVVAGTDIDLSEIVPATVITTGTAGWFWQIDTVDYRDIGYVYASDYLSEEAATEELLEHIGDAELSRSVDHYEFTAGYHPNAWTGNCIAVGNALGFVEPIQSTALTSNALLALDLADIIEGSSHLNYDGTREMYNTHVQTVWENINTFVQIHYRCAPGGTEFWDSVSSDDAYDLSSIPEYENYQTYGFSLIDRADNTLLRPNAAGRFPHLIHYRVLHGLGVRSNFYDEIDVDYEPEVVERVEEYEARLSDEVETFYSYEELYSDIISVPDR
ncbi:tryptophan 7-halogenase [Halobacteria archaeon AArc-dxtr1]|nr:tryptophan 7-halogenase [Halobacteria archaeon AArc-dxtr1]